MCPVCIITIGGGFFIAQKLGLISLIIFILAIFVTMKIIMIDKQKKSASVPSAVEELRRDKGKKEADFFEGINQLIKKILNCCG